MTPKRLALRIVAAAAAVVLTFTILCTIRVHYGAKGRIHTDPFLIPAGNVAVVLGCPPTRSFRFPNPEYTARIKAAARLYLGGRARHIIVSGSPEQPAVMKADLVAAGVPADKIASDPGGYRTLASIIRARDSFGQRSFTVVSQPYHCARAIYLADSYGLDVVGFAAEDPRKDGHHGFLVDRRTRRGVIREFFARAKAVLDVHILPRNPKFPGEGTPIPDPNTLQQGAINLRCILAYPPVSQEAA